MNTAPFTLDLDIKAVDPQSDGSLILDGYASTWELDRDREAVTPDALRKALDGYLRNPVLLLEHDQRRPIGRITEATIDDIGVRVKAVVTPPVAEWAREAFQKIKDGVYKAFSIGGIFERVGRQISGVDWAETSVISVPSNRASLFDVTQKAFEVLDRQHADLEGLLAAAQRLNLVLDGSKAGGYNLAHNAVGASGAGDFAFVDADGRGHLPIHDAAHVRAALARFDQTQFPSDAVKTAARTRILAAATKFGIQVADGDAADAGKAAALDAKAGAVLNYSNRDHLKAAHAHLVAMGQAGGTNLCNSG